MAYDAMRQRVVLFGGREATNRAVAGTYEWDGTAWAARMPAVSPPAVSGHAMAYDAARQRVVLAAVNVTRSTWEWDGATWVERARPVIPPAGRLSHAMATDGGRQRVVLFGGTRAGGRLGGLDDTAEWNGVAWTFLNPANRPPRLAHHAMAFDAASGRVLLFGGYANAVQSDTWAWDGSNWTQLIPGTSPAARDAHALASDTARARIVLFGGRDQNLVPLDDTWEWNGTTWIARSPMVRPPARAGHGLTFDAARGRTVMFGGRGSFGMLFDTWEWDGSSWTLKSVVGPSARQGHQLVYDARRRSVLLIGGADSSDHVLDDTWEWTGGAWVEVTVSLPGGRSASAAAYDPVREVVLLVDGTTTTDELLGRREDTLALGVAAVGGARSVGCSRGRPHPISIATFGQPVRGNPGFALDVVNLGAGAPLVVMLSPGAVRQFVDGCPLIVDPSLLLAVVGSANGFGAASIRLPVPDDRQLVGSSLWTESVALDAGALVFSGALLLRIGD